MPKQKMPSPPAGPFEQIPNEIMLQIFSWLDFETAKKARCVTRKWKALMDISRNLIFTCHLTDSTISTVANAMEELPYVKIYDLLQSAGVCTTSRGIGRILSKAKHIQLSGKDINAEELSKIMKCTATFLQQLSIHRSRISVVKPLLCSRLKFKNLTTLSFAFGNFPKKRHTHFFERLPRHTSSLPSLESLKVVYELADIDYLRGIISNIEMTPSANDIFRNYLAIINVVVAFKNTLKQVEIIRDDMLRTVLALEHVNNNQVRMNDTRREQINQCIEGLQGVQLDKLHITPLRNEGVFPWNLETTLLQEQRELKEITINKRLFSFFFHGQHNFAQLLPINPEFFTSVKISISFLNNAPVNLSFFAQCPNLRTLWLVYNRVIETGPTRLHFTNIEQLPTTITSLHFKSSQEDIIIIHQQSILNRNQVRWVIDNLRNLESLWLQLATEERNEVVDAAAAARANNVNAPPPHVLQPVNPENGEQVDDIRRRLEAHRAAQAAYVAAGRLIRRANDELNNVNANINVATFRELIRMPNLKEMKFDMLKAGQLASILEIGDGGNPHIPPMGVRVTPDDIREYIDICQEERGISSDARSTNFYPIGFLELTICKKKPTTYFTN